MPKGKTPDTNRDELQKELNALKAEVEQLRSSSLPNNSLMEEMQKLKKISRKQDQSNKIQVLDVDDHRNVKMYTAFNKCIEVHPSNAMNMLQYYHTHGVQLFTSPRTDEQVEEYRNRPDIKAKLEREAKVREGYVRKSGKNRVEEIARAIAKETNKPIEQLTKVLSKEQAGVTN